MTVEEFEEFVLLPENEDKLFEYIGGEAVEVLSRPYDSSIAARIGAYIGIFLLNHDLGSVTGEGGGYQVSGERYIPNVAYISYSKIIDLPKEGYVPHSPDLAVELLASDNEPDIELSTIKLSNYLAAGTVVWIVRPEKKTAEVYQPGKPVITLHEKDALDGGYVLPGLKINLKDIFK